MNWIKKNAPGIIMAFIVAMGATWLGKVFPIVGGAVFGILIGILINNIFGKPNYTLDGVKFTSKKILQWAIIIMGARLSLIQVYKTGIESFNVMILTLISAFISAYFLGKLMKVPFHLTSLIGMGTAICGGSAIAALSPVIEAEEKDIAYAISTIFFFNVIAVLIFPPLGLLLGFSDQAFGIWAGTAINDTSSVVAAAYEFSNAAGDYATIVKLTRTTMIIPISLIYAVIITIKKKRESREDSSVNYSIKKIFPWFIIWFLVAALLNTMGVFNSEAIHYFKIIGKFMIIMALSAIGLSADFRKMLQSGIKPLVLGLCVWFVVAMVSLGVQFSTGLI